MANEELIAEIERGESKTLEFKLELPFQSEKYIKTLVAYANTAGGKLLVGVRNRDKAIIGVPNAAQVIDTIASAMSDMIEPLIVPSITKETIEGKDIVVVEISPGSNCPYHIKSKGIDDGTYIKIGATTHLADKVSIMELRLRGESQSYDEQIYVEADYSENDALELCKVIDGYRKASARDKGNAEPTNDVTPKNLENWGVTRKYHGKLVPTRAFMLLTNNPFRFAKIQCAQFKGTDRVVFLDKRDYEGPLYEQIEEAVKFVLRNIRLGAEINGLLREESYELPIKAIREAIINATIHRNFMLTSYVQVALYDDRLEVSSPGALYGSLTIEKALAGTTALRNPVIAEVFKQMDLFESWGTGLRRIQQSCKDLGLSEPEFLEIGDMFRVNIFRAPAIKSAIKSAIKESSPVFTGNVEAAKTEIKRLLRANSKTTYRELSEEMGLSFTTLRSHIASLKKAGELKHEGSTRGGYWIVID